MNAKGIKKGILKDYKDSIEDYERSKKWSEITLTVREARIRHLEHDLMSFFSINKEYDIKTGLIKDRLTGVRK